MTCPSRRTSSFSLTLTTACSNSDDALVAVFASGKLICTSGWSRLNVVETTKKISWIAARDAAVIALRDQIRNQRFHFDRHHFDLLREVTEGNQGRHCDR